MAEIVGIRFKKVGKVYHFNPCGLQLHVGQNVIVETSRGVECGEVAFANKEVQDESVVKPLKRIVRIATPSDAKVVETNAKRAEEAFHICEEKIAQHHLDMKLVSVEYSFDLSKVLFYFTADGRVDFRDLVKDLASVFRTRIELRQIGVRDEAKVLGGLGICGRPLCCSSFLEDFQPVSINMAKEQNLSLNPTKISGTCGRLMCCLKYEHEVYAELSRITPHPDSLVETPRGTGVVIDSSILRGTCAVRLDDDPDEIHTFKCTECKITHASRKGKKSSSVAARAAAAAALSTKEKSSEPSQEMMEALRATSIPMNLDPVAQPPEKSSKNRQRRRKRNDEPHQKHREGAPKNQRRGDKKSHPPKQRQDGKQSEHREGAPHRKPKHRQKPQHNGAPKASKGE